MFAQHDLIPFVMIYYPQKPLWLEMQNVHPTALRQTPTRLILKLGDDLRQDMITLRMFSLFEKVHMKNLPSAAYAPKKKTQKKTSHGQQIVELEFVNCAYTVLKSAQNV